MTTHRQRTAAELRARAQEILAKHQYTRMADGMGTEVWECSRPGSSTYAFTIALTRHGIAMMGDLCNLTFTVGSGYGLEFLAGTDIDYYVYSKLDSHCRPREFDRDALRDFICRKVAGFISERYRSEDGHLPAGAPAFVEAPHNDSLPRDFTALQDWLDGAGTGIWRFLHSRVAQFAACESGEQATELLLEHEEDLGLGEWSSCMFTCPSTRTMQSLYCLHHAANAILDIKANAIAGGAA